MTKEKPIYPIKALNNALSVLEMILQRGPILGVHEISRSLRLYPSSVYRILYTLKSRGYVEQDPINKKYRLGLKIAELGMARLDQMNLEKEAASHLKELVDRCQETAHLGTLENGEMLYLASEEPSQTIRMVHKVGTRAPLHCTALGKVILSSLPEKEIEKIIDKKGLPRFTENTITDEKELRRELRRVKKQGFALDREEYEKDVSCIATSIKNYQGKTVAAISISGPTFRMSGEKQKYMKEALIQKAISISKQLGH